ncbi:hypothetical protein LCGC14_2279220, partial [marine sediment metagenome]
MLADILPQEVESIVDMRDGRLLQGERQPTFLQEGLDEWHHFPFQDFSTRRRNGESSGAGELPPDALTDPNV